MSEPNDPGRAGVKAGRVVGILTATLAVLTVWQGWSAFSEGLTVVFGLEPALPTTALFWGNAALVAVARYTFCYVVGSLVGMLYGWLDQPPLPVLIGVVLVVGAADGILAGIDTQSVLVGLAYVVAWLWYVPVFVWLFDPGAGDSRSGPRRLGDS
ncbi:MAG: hypothetical protein V5A55_08210 [Halovenus sp.]